MDWTLDSLSIVFWADGKIRRIDTDGSKLSVIPFAVDDTRDVASAPHPVIPVERAQVEVSTPRFAERSPDSRAIVFESLASCMSCPPTAAQCGG